MQSGKNHKYIKGQVMLLSILLIGASILGATSIAGYLMLRQLRLSSDIVNSTKAIFAADTGIEWELYKCFKCNPDFFCDPDCTALDSQKPSMTNNSSVSSTVIYDNNGLPQSIKSVGSASQIHRAFMLELGE